MAKQDQLPLTGGANISNVPVYTAPAIGEFKLAGRVSLDIETHDPDIKSRIGTFDPAARILGVGLAHDHNDATYYATHSTYGSGELVDEGQFRAWLQQEAAAFTGELVGANLQYDLSMLRSKWGVIFPRASIRDVQIAEPLLDENQYSYSLDNILARNGFEGKLSSILEPHGGIKNMINIPPAIVAEYAIRDITAPIDLIDHQLKRLEREGLMGVFETESKLIPILVDMHMRGVPIDLEKANEAYDRIGRGIKDTQEALGGIDVWSAASVATLFDWTPSTPSGTPSITKPWLKAEAKNGNEAAAKVLNIRTMDKIRSTFIKSYILDKHVNGRIHCSFHPLRSDEGGAVSGRFSSSGPNLQNIPSRDPVYGPLMRSMFLPEQGCLWGCADWSQIEYRLLIHFANTIPDIDDSARRARDNYINDPKTDFHVAAAEITGLPRGDAKGINFGVLYGMGKDTMAKNLGKSLDESEKVLKKFHSAMPYLKETYQFVLERADMRGYIKTISGRRRRFNEYEAKVWKTGDKFQGTKEECMEWADDRRGAKVGRAGVHAALNALLQGSNADLMKEAMVKMQDDGVFDVLKPHLIVHDELDSSLPNNQEGLDAFEHSVKIMEQIRTLNIPVLASHKTGSNWDEAK